MSTIAHDEINELVSRVQRANEVFTAFGDALIVAADTLLANPTEQGMRTFLASLSMLLEEVDRDMRRSKAGGT